MDFEAIKAAAQNYQADMTRFLREMISHPSESCEEREVAHCINIWAMTRWKSTVSATSSAGWVTARRSSPSTPTSTR